MSKIPEETQEEIPLDDGVKLETIGIADIFAPLPAIPWVVHGLRLAPGAPIALAGYGFSGKTLFAQEIALCVASDKRVFDIFECARGGRALHIDFEQGQRITSERYQRLARGKGISPEQLGDRLRVAVLPTWPLDAKGAEDIYKRTIDGFTFVVIDSLRAACPSADENSSEIRQHLDVLNRVSEATKATILIVHHSRKPKDGESPLDAMMMRGSGAIFDGCSTVFLMGGEKGEPARVSHHKCRHMGTTLEDFGVQIEDVADPGKTDPRFSLKVTHLAPEQLSARARERTEAKAAERAANVIRSGKKPTDNKPESTSSTQKGGHHYGLELD